METPAARGFGERVLGAALLDRGVFTEVSADRAATLPAGVVVVFAAVCNALGQARAIGWFDGSTSLVAVWATWVLWTLVGPIIAWILWTLVVAVVARAFGHTAGDRSLLRALGFANAPSVALLLRIVPGVGAIVYVAVVLWLLAAAVAAVEAVFAISRRRAAGIVGAAFVAYWLVGLGLQTWATG